jgi:hypothetical protein
VSLTDELRKLETLRWNGTLTDAEFDRAKAALLAQFGPHAPPDAADKLAEHLAEVRYQNELERIDREWAQERERYMVAGEDGSRHVATVAEERGRAVMAGVVGGVWTAFALWLTSRGPGDGAPLFFRLLFPLFGVLVIVCGIWSGLQAAQKAEAYTRAEAAYQRRRAAVKPEDFRGSPPSS